MNRRAFLTTAAMTPILASAFGPVRAQTAGGRLLYVGTYTNTAAGSKGIYAWRFDAATNTVTSLGLAAETDSPSWVVVHPNKRLLYAANELPPPEAGGPAGAVTTFSIDAASGKLTQIGRVKTNGLAPAHMLVDPTGKWAIVGNYGNSAGSEGTSIAVFAIGADGKLADTPKAFVPHVPKPKRLDPAAPPPKNGNPPTSHPHCVLLSPDSRFLFVAEKGFDEIVVYHFDAVTGCADAEHRAGRRGDEVWRRASSSRLWKDRKVPLRLLRGRACCRDLCVRRGTWHAEPTRHSVDAATGSAADRFVRRDRGVPGRHSADSDRLAVERVGTGWSGGPVR